MTRRQGQACPDHCIWRRCGSSRDSFPLRDGWAHVGSKDNLIALAGDHVWNEIPLPGPGKARHDDHAIAIYEAAGFPAPQTDQAIATVFTFVLGNALGPAAQASLTKKLSRDGGNPHELLRETMAKATEIASQFPRLRARLNASGADYAAAPDKHLRIRPPCHPRRPGSPTPR